MAAYIHFSNSVTGPCEVEEHKGWIVLESWGWSCAREQSGQNQVGLASGVAKFEPLTFNASIGSATVAMYQKMIFGTHFDDVIIHCTKNTGGVIPEVWMKLELKHCLVTSISQAIDEDTAADDVALTFSSFELSIADQKGDGKLDTPKKFAFDLVTKKG